MKKFNEINGVIVTEKRNPTNTKGTRFVAKYKDVYSVTIPDVFDDEDGHEVAMKKLVEKYNIEIGSKIAYRIEDFFTKNERVLWGFSL
jgi:hypothetical protein